MFYKIAVYAYTLVDFYNSPTHKHILSIHCVHFIAKRVHTSTFYLFTVSTSFPSASTSEHLQGTSVHLHRTSRALFFVVATFFPWTKCRLLHEPRPGGRVLFLKWKFGWNVIKLNFMMVFRVVLERNKNLKYQKICLRRLSFMNKDLFDSNIHRNIIHRVLDRAEGARNFKGGF